MLKKAPILTAQPFVRNGFSEYENSKSQDNPVRCIKDNTPSGFSEQPKH
jgi:hypothetical protein